MFISSIFKVNNILPSLGAVQALENSNLIKVDRNSKYKVFPVNEFMIEFEQDKPVTQLSTENICRV